MIQLAARIVGHGEGGVAAEAILGLPMLRREAGNAKFLRQIVLMRIYVGVDAGGESFQDGACVGRVIGVLGRHRSAITQQAGVDVALHRRRAHHFRQAALAGTLPQLHLEQPVAGRDITLREKQVVLIPGVDVGHAPGVAQHFDGLAQSHQPQLRSLLRTQQGHEPERKRSGE